MCNTRCTPNCLRDPELWNNLSTVEGRARIQRMEACPTCIPHLYRLRIREQRMETKVIVLATIIPRVSRATTVHLIRATALAEGIGVLITTTALAVKTITKLARKTGCSLLADSQENYRHQTVTPESRPSLCHHRLRSPPEEHL